MYICERCHGVFESPSVIVERHGMDCSPYEYVEVCSWCKNTEFKEAIKCKRCNKTVAAEDAKGVLCQECAERAISRLKYLLRNEFDQNELDYLDSMIEGTGISEPEVIKAR